MELGLAGRSYVVTGGTRGLGRASAEALVADGASVVVSGRTQRAADAAAAELTAAARSGARAVGVGADNADPQTADRLVAAALEAFGAVHGGLISVGGPPGGGLPDITDEQWRDSFDRVFLGAVRIARAVIAAAGTTADAAGRGAATGSVVFVLSTTVLTPSPTLAISNGLRPGLQSVARSLAAEAGRTGVRVNSLLPGSVETDRIRELLDQVDDPAEHRRRVEASIPLGRYGRPAEFGAVAAFLLSPAAGYLNGVSVPVDGGMNA